MPRAVAPNADALERLAARPVELLDTFAILREDAEQLSRSRTQQTSFGNCHALQHLLRRRLASRGVPPAGRQTILQTNFPSPGELHGEF